MRCCAVLLDCFWCPGVYAPAPVCDEWYLRSLSLMYVYVCRYDYDATIIDVDSMRKTLLIVVTD